MNLDPQLRTDKITPELIDYIVAKIVREIQPEKIILHGSYARGDFHEDSDLDLFIIKGAMNQAACSNGKLIVSFPEGCSLLMRGSANRQKSSGIFAHRILFIFITSTRMARCL